DLTNDQNVRIRLRHRLDRLVNLLHRLRRADDVEILGACGELAPHVRSFRNELTTFECLFNEWLQLIEVERFLNEIESTGFRRFNSFLYRTVTRDNDHFCCRPCVLHVTQYFQSVHVRQLQVAERQVMSALIEELDGGRTGRCSIDRVSLLDEILPQRISHHWFVVYHKNPHFFVLHPFLLSRNRCAMGHDDYSLYLFQFYQASGMTTTNFRSINFADPPCASMIFAARASLISSLPANERNGS